MIFFDDRNLSDLSDTSDRSDGGRYACSGQPHGVAPTEDKVAYYQLF